MKTNRYLQKSIAAMVAACALFSAATSQAALYYVNINTNPLLSLPASAFAPFSLGFQFNDGGLLLNNTATVSGFNFGGGSATGSAITLGGAVGDIATSVTFDNSSAFQELYQTFNPGTSLSFAVNLTTTVDFPAPDLFSVSILDSGLQNITTDGFGNSLVSISLDSLAPVPVYSQGTGDFAGVVAAVPEPASAGFIVSLGLFGVASLRRKRGQAA